MRVAIDLAGGLVLWAVCLGIAKLVGSDGASTTATAVFICIWLVATLASLRNSLARPRRSVRRELRIFLATFLFPVSVAIYMNSKFL